MTGAPVAPVPRRREPDALHVVPEGDAPADHVPSVACRCGPRGGFVGLGDGRPVVRHMPLRREPRWRVQPTAWGSGR